MSGETPGRRRLPLWGRVALWVVGIGLVLVVAAGVWFVAMLSGGFDDLLGGPGPGEDDARVVEASETAAAELATTAEEVRGLAGGAAAVAVGQAASCQEGQHNWKIDDPYDLSCRRTHAVVVAGGPLTTFREDMTALDAALVAAGWAPGGFSVPRVLEGYWDRRESALANNPAWSYPHDMPSAGYTRDRWQLSLAWVEPARLDDQERALGYGTEWADLDGDPVDQRDIAALLPDDGYGVRLTVSTTYFEQ